MTLSSLPPVLKERISARTLLASYTVVPDIPATLRLSGNVPHTKQDVLPLIICHIPTSAG